MIKTSEVKVVVDQNPIERNDWGTGFRIRHYGYGQIGPDALTWAIQVSSAL
jgi:hypothetical protein